MVTCTTKTFNIVIKRIAPLLAFGSNRNFIGSKCCIQSQKSISLTSIPQTGWRVSLTSSRTLSSAFEVAIMEGEQEKASHPDSQDVESNREKDNGNSEGMLQSAVMISTTTENLEKPRHQAKHSFEEVMKEPFAVEQAQKKLKLDGQEDPTEKLAALTGKSAEDADVSGCSENVADSSIFIQEDSMDSVISGE